MKNLLTRLFERYFLAPFSNKVTKTLLYVGGLLLAFPTIDFLILDILVSKLLGYELGFSYPTSDTLIAGCVVLFLAVTHNLAIQRIEQNKNRREITTEGGFLCGNFTSAEITELLGNQKDSEGSLLDYDKIRDKYGPIMHEAVFEIDRGNPNKGGEMIRSILNDMPLGVIGPALLNLGYYLSSIGDKKDKEYYFMALRLFEDSEYTEGLSRLYRNLGESYRREHEFGKAEEYQKKAIEVAEKNGDQADIADAVGNLAVTYAQQCHHSEAEIEFIRAIKIYESLNADSAMKRIDGLFDIMKSCPKYKCEQVGRYNCG